MTFLVVQQIDSYARSPQYLFLSLSFFIGSFKWLGRFVQGLVHFRFYILWTVDRYQMKSPTIWQRNNFQLVYISNLHFWIGGYQECEIHRRIDTILLLSTKVFSFGFLQSRIINCLSQVEWKFSICVKKNKQQMIAAASNRKGEGGESLLPP